MCRRILIRRFSVPCFTAVAGLLAGFCGTAQAALFWYDGFTTGPGGDYVADAALGGQTGGAGTFFIGPWLQQGGNDHIVYADGLSNPGPGGQPVTGGSVGDDVNAAGCCTTSRSARTMTTPWAGFTNPDGTFYLSFLGNYGAGPTDHHRVLEMWEGDHGDDGNRNLQLGYSTFTGIGTDFTLRVRDEADGAEDNYVIDKDLATAGVQPLQFNSDGATHHIVLRFDLTNDDKALGGVGDRIRVYLDPVGPIEPAVPNADTGSIDFLVDRMGVITNFIFGPTTAPRFDELRVGTTFLDVRGVPEPGTISLLALGALGILSTTRRRPR